MGAGMLRILRPALILAFFLAGSGMIRAHARRIDGRSIDIEIIRGYRNDSRIRFDLPSGVLGGVRARDGDLAGFLSLSLGGRARLMAGDFKIRAGEGVILGAWERRFFLYRGAGRRGALFHVAPSRSTWWRQSGCALSL